MMDRNHFERMRIPIPMNMTSLALIVDGEKMALATGMHEFRKELEKRYGLTPEDTSARYLHSEEMRLFKCGDLTTSAFWDKIISRWGIQATQGELIDLLVAQYTLNEEFFSWIPEARAKLAPHISLKLGYCSNTSPDRFNGAEARLHFARYFDAMALSYDRRIQAQKPNPKIYGAILERLGIPKERAFFSDDSERNVKGAMAYGITSEVYANMDLLKEQFGAFVRRFEPNIQF